MNATPRSVRAIRTRWIDPAAPGIPGTGAARTAAGEGDVIVTNHPERLEETAGAAALVDLLELQRLVRPEQPVTAPDAGFRERECNELWRGLAREIDAMPTWALSILSPLCEALGERGCARLFEDASRRPGAEGSWVDFFPATVKRVERPASPDLGDCTALDPDEVGGYLQPDGALARRVEGYEPRPGQIEMLRAVVAAFNRGRHLLVEAGTGVGKSLAYLLPAALWARLNDVPVVISTNTRNLQAQLMHKDLPDVQRVIAAGGPSAAPLRTALIKGRSNYLCLRRLGQFMDHWPVDLERRELRQFARALCWALRTGDGDLDILGGGVGIESGFLSQLAMPGEDCPGRACPLYRRCFLQKARERALRADIVIANHALVFAEMDNPGVALPQHAQVVFDEAHNLEEAATRYFAVECSPLRLNQLLRRLASGSGARRRGSLERLRRRLTSAGNGPRQALLRREIRQTLQSIDTLRASGRALFKALLEQLDPDGNPLRYRFPPAEKGAPAPAAPPDGTRPVPPRWDLVVHARAELLDHVGITQNHLKTLAELLLEGVEGELNLMTEESAEIAGAVQALKSFGDDTRIVLDGCDPEYVFWVQSVRLREPLGAACAAPLNIGPLLSDALYNKRQSVVFSSATLTVGGRFDFIGERLGLDRIPPDRLDTCIAQSPFNYPSQCQVLAPSFLSEPNDPRNAYVDGLADLLRNVTRQLEGRTLVLFTSYAMLRQCARLLEAPLREAGLRLLAQGADGSRDYLMQVFRGGRRCVLLGTHSFWEGVDVIGEALSCVVLARLPFTSPGDPIFSARCDRLDREGRGSFRLLSLPTAVLRFRQGFGRLIRHRNDRGVVIVADRRFLTKSYGAVFRRSLPSPTLVCEDIDAVTARIGSFLEAGVRLEG